MKPLTFITFLIAVSNTFCSAQYMQLFPGNTGTYSGVHTNDLMTMSPSEAPNASNSEISGNPFWDENWNTAILYTDDIAILVPKVE